MGPRSEGTAGPLATVVIADDDPMIRRLLERIFDDHDSATIVGVAENGDQAVALSELHRPDVIILDHMMGGRNGLDVADEILGRFPEQRIILYTSWPDATLQERAAAIGIEACVEKTDPMAILELLQPR